MTRREYMLAYMRARRRPDLHRFSRRVWDVGSAIDPTQDDEARRHDAEQGSRLLLEAQVRHHQYPCKVADKAVDGLAQPIVVPARSGA